MKPEDILNLRKALSRTQQQMATLVGTTKVTWCRWENGKSEPLPIYRNKLIKLINFVGKKQEVPNE